MMIETENGLFELIKNHKEGFEVEAFNQRYVDYLDKYEFIVGDISAEKLRLKGFFKKEVELIPDFLMESAVPNAPYYVLKRIKPDVSKEKKDES